MHMTRQRWGSRSPSGGVLAPGSGPRATPALVPPIAAGQPRPVTQVETVMAWLSRRS